MATSDTEGRAAEAAGGGPRILIVDDIEENLTVLTETLIPRGYRPLQARSGERAVQIAKKARPDLILLDIRMPGMDGYETIGALKADPETADIPVIFISALNQIEDKVRGFEAGAVDYVSKPFQKEEVVARVGTHLALRRALRDVETERARSEALLGAILPRAVAEELKAAGRSAPRTHAAASILFSDIVGFTARASALEPVTLIGELDAIFAGFDAIMLGRGCERIKTIGDAYLAACGIPDPVEDHALRLVEAARAMVAWLGERNRAAAAAGGLVWEIRVGVHSGAAVSGIVGTTKYLYDVFGDSVNVASRMEQASEPMRINVSGATAALLGGRVPLEPRPPMEVKGKGMMEMAFVAG